MELELFTPNEWSFAVKVADLVTTNPFDPDWRKKESILLGHPVPAGPPVWIPDDVRLWGPQSVYSEELHTGITEIGARLRQRLLDGRSASEEELAQYELVAFYCLYCTFGPEMDELIRAAVRPPDPGRVEGQPGENDRRRAVKGMWERFRTEHQRLVGFKNLTFPRNYKPEYLFACFFLFRRAFYHIFFNIVGTSRPIAELRSAVWESIVTHDLLGWMRGLHRRMKDFPTLITGPSGTGKERVAEAIGRSLYVAFDPAKKAFEIDFLKAFNPVNLAALPPLLIEAELFGHVKGSFAGAVRDRVGRLEECPEQGAVFLDEIGELTPEIQVKLLRVLQTRRLQRVGENDDKLFHGKIIAATNRDLAAEMQAGRFREDFYYRLCADQITTPSLREQLADCPEDLPLLVEFVCRSVVGEEKAAGLAEEVVAWIARHLRGYAWPGNFRELEQCVRSYTIRKEYHPAQPPRRPVDDGPQRPPCDPVGEACEALATAVLRAGATCADESELKKKRVFAQIKRRLFTLVHAHTRTDREAATLLGIDVRTLKAGKSE